MPKSIPIIAAIALLLIIPTIALAQPATPHKFIGQAYIDGQPAAAGTEIAAIVNGQQIATATVTDEGAFTLLVDQPSGGRIITFQVNGQYARETATWTQGAISYPFNLHAGGAQPPAQVFAPLITAGILSVVWHYHNATQTWTSFAPDLPAELNDLTLLTAGDIVWLKVTSESEFQGQNLREGWNVIALR